VKLEIAGDRYEHYFDSVGRLHFSFDTCLGTGSLTNHSALKSGLMRRGKPRPCQVRARRVATACLVRLVMFRMVWIEEAAKGKGEKRGEIDEP